MTNIIGGKITDILNCVIALFSKSEAYKSLIQRKFIPVSKVQEKFSDLNIEQKIKPDMLKAGLNN